MALRKKTRSKPGAPSDENTALKIRIRGKDNAPLSIQEFSEGLLDLIRHLKQYEPDYRVKYPSLYMTVIDADGQPVRINNANELILYPYRAAADEYGL